MSYTNEQHRDQLQQPARLPLADVPLRPFAPLAKRQSQWKHLLGNRTDPFFVEQEGQP